MHYVYFYILTVIGWNWQIVMRGFIPLLMCNFSIIIVNVNVNDKVSNLKVTIQKQTVFNL